MDFVLNKLDNELRYLLQRYTQLNPKTNFKKGYAQVLKNNKIVPLKELKIDEVFTLEDIDTKMSVKVLDKKKI
jgi:exonuclease VII large subunit